MSKDFDTDIRSYLLFQGIFGENLLNLLREPSLKGILKSASNGCAEDFLMAFALCYGLDEAFSSQVSSALFHFYDQDILKEEFFDNWVNDNLDFNEASPVYNKIALSQLKTKSQEFLDWLKNAEEEEEGEKEKEEEEQKLQPEQETESKRVDERKESESNHKIIEENTEDKIENNDIMSQLNSIEDFSIDDI